MVNGETIASQWLRADIWGLNDKDKWDPIRNEIEESCANIFCLQETKREAIDL
jgi:hypothetical protein